MRWNDATTSFTVTGWPFENLIPLRSLKTQVLPPFVGVGRFCGEVGDDGERGVAARLLEGEQTVVGRLVELPVLRACS